MFAAWLSVQWAGVIAQPQVQLKSSPSEESLRRFLQNYTSPPPSPEDRSTRYSEAHVDLNDDGKSEVIVYLVGPQWCGSGGCTVLILTEGPAFAVLTKITVVRAPIRVLAAKTNGWHNLAVRVQGGAVTQGYEAILEFDGKSYPGNPTLPPARPARRKVKGKVAIGTSLKELKPLYP
jgi:hypothetical protein